MPETTSDPAGTHDWHSDEYVEWWISADVTHDDDRKPLLDTLAGLLPFERDAPVRVLDVGAGYGMLSRAVLDAFPQASLVLHDFSEPMTDHARRRLTDAADRITFAYSDLRDPAWADVVDGPFDAVVSSLAIHNVRDPERIRSIYREVRPLVRPGGCFYNIDHLGLAGPLTAHAMWPGRSFNPSPEPAPTLVNHLRWLEEAGFDEADCLLRSGSQTLVAGFCAA